MGFRIENNSKKPVRNQQHTDYSATIWYGRVLKDSLYDTLELDNTVYHTFKSYNELWYNNHCLYNLYNNSVNHIGFIFDFKTDELPKRCNSMFSTLVSCLTDHLRLSRTRVSRAKVRITVKYFLKNISRMKYHNVYAMLYSRSHTFWDGKVTNLSNEYFLELVDYLQDKRKVMSFSGFTCKESNISSMLLVLPEFINECNGYSKDQLMDDCLRHPEQTLCEIRVKKGKDSYKVIKPSEEDLPVFQEAVNILTQFGDIYTESQIAIGNKFIPEYFLHRVYLDNVNCCGRFFDKGEIQGSSKALRSTITIDGEETIELDFKNLHYAFAAEELGLDLKGIDPYDFEFHISADYSEINDFKQQYSIEKYNPIRNLKKMALLVMINAKDKKSAVSGISNEIFKDKCKKDQSTRKYVGLNKVSVTDLVNAVIEHNQCISKYLNSGAGIRFQNLDSRIIEYCIKEFIKIRQVFLPVHDSLIVKKSLADFTKKCMIDGYEHVMGSKVNCIVE